MRIGCENYAKTILKDNGCSASVYSGASVKTIITDLELAYPDGMAYPYEDVAACIAKMAGNTEEKPVSNEVPKYKVFYDTDSIGETITVNSLEEGKQKVLDIYQGWIDAANEDNYSNEQWNDMLYNNVSGIEKWDAARNSYTDCWFPEDSVLKEMGWDFREDSNDVYNSEDYDDDNECEIDDDENVSHDNFIDDSDEDEDKDDTDESEEETDKEETDKNDTSFFNNLDSLLSNKLSTTQETNFKNLMNRLDNLKSKAEKDFDTIKQEMIKKWTPILGYDIDSGNGYSFSRKVDAKYDSETGKWTIKTVYTDADGNVHTEIKVETDK